jgi:hypothetical protein
MWQVVAALAHSRDENDGAESLTVSFRVPYSTAPVQGGRTMGHTSRVAALVVMASLVSSVAGAENKERAREMYRAASQHYDFGEYKQALDGFKEAYRNYEDPAFLFNIAQCHRALGDKQDAVLFYRSYLRKSSDAPNRAEVQNTIAELDAQIAADKQRSPSNPSSSVHVDGAKRPPTPAVQPATATETAPMVAAEAPTKRDRPAWKRGWVWGVVAGVVAIGIGVGVGVGVGTASHGPKATDGAVTF